MNKKAETTCSCSKEKAFDEELCPECQKIQKGEKHLLVETQGKELVEVNATSDIIKLAISSGADLDKLEKLLTLKERYDATEARKAFVKAMADFKKNPPDIYRDMQNKQFDSWYTSLNGLDLGVYFSIFL